MDIPLAPDLDPSDPFNARRLLPNLVCRVVLGILAILLAIIPGRLLWRNGEFAAVVFILTTTLLNLFNVVNSLLWRDDNFDTWWDGKGWCDIQAYTSGPLIVVYAASIFAVMHNLANQVGMLRANPLTVMEKRRRNLLQAAIIFTVPIIEIAVTFPLLKRRYFVAALRGCVVSYDNSTPTLVVFYIWPIIFSASAAIYAGLTWMRFREVEKTTRVVLSSTANSSISSRAQRAKRRLFLMSVCIIIPYAPLQVAIAAIAIRRALPLVPYSFDRVHNHAVPFPWEDIVFLPSFMLDFTTMYLAYIPIITIVPIFWFFGKTKDAINIYREFLLRLGLGKLFPCLRDEYNPDRCLPHGTGSTTSRLVDRLTALVKKEPDGTQGSLPRTATGGSGDLRASKSTATTCQTTAGTTGSDHYGRSPFPGYSNVASGEKSRATPTMPQRMPWLFRTTLDIRLPFTSTTKTKTGTPMKPKPAACRQTAASMSSAAGVTAHIWSDKEAAKSTRIFSAKDRNHQAPPSEHGAGGSGTFVVQIGIRRSSENVHVSEKK